MFQFPGFALKTLCIQVLSTCLCSLLISRTNNNKHSGGLPHSEIHGSKLILSSPWLIAEYHVFHRLLLPRHSPNALLALDLIQKKKDLILALPPIRLLEDVNSFGLRPSQFGVGSIETAQLVTKGSHSSEPKTYISRPRHLDEDK